MSENLMPEQDVLPRNGTVSLLLSTEVALNAQPPTPAEGVAGPLNDIDPAKLAALEERLKEFKKREGTTESGSEAVDDVPSTFNSKEWEYDTALEHLYNRSQVEDTPEGPKWVVMEHQYWILTGQWHIEHSGEPRLTSTGTAQRDKQGRVQYHAKGLDHMIQEIINGPDGMLSRQKGWRLSALLPGQMGQGVAILERQAKRALPDPKPIVKPEEQPLEKITDEELARMQDKAKEWTGEQAMTEAVVEGDAEVLAEIQGALEQEAAGVPDKTEGGQ